MPYKDPKKQREAERNSKRRKRGACGGETKARARENVVQPDAATLDGIIDAIQHSLAEVMNDEAAGALSRGRVVAQLASQALKAHEAGVLSDRMEAVEAALQMRKAANR